jgi:hypothetical protein
VSPTRLKLVTAEKVHVRAERAGTGNHAISKEKGFLAKQLYLVHTALANGMGPVIENIQAHLAFRQSRKRGRLRKAIGLSP